MQHRYVGDVGDFGKYALLSALAASGLRLGVIWYLNERAENNSDGKFTQFGHLANLAPELFDKLKIIRRKLRHLDGIESGNVLPEDTLFASVSLPYPTRPCYSATMREIQRRLREEWFCEAIREVSDSQLVFLDPDNGIATPSLKLHSTKACKYVFEDEIQTLLKSDRSVVVYQHQHRNGTLEEQVEALIKRFSAIAPNGFGITSHAFTVRAYLILPANRVHAELLRERTNQFVKSEWRNMFKAHGQLKKE